MVAKDSDDVKVRVRSLKDYKKDPDNANRGSERGRKMIADSFKELGPGRSLLADGADTLIAGNNAIDGALAAGIEKAIEVEVPADAVVVVKRSDLLPGELKTRRMAVADNRTNQVNLEFDPERLLADRPMIEGFFRDDELEDLLAEGEVNKAVTENLQEGVTGGRLSGDTKKQVKPVLYVDEIAVFERAIRSTGLVNRGQAVLEICRFYLERKSDEQTEPAPVGATAVQR